MKPHLLVFILSLLQYVCFAQKNELSIDNKPLEDVIGEIESFYGVKFSFVDELLTDKVITIQSTSKGNVKSFLEDLQYQTQLRFELVDPQYVIIRSFNDNDVINICGRILDANKKPIEGVLVLPAGSKKGAITDENGNFSLEGVAYNSRVSYQHIGYNGRNIKTERFLQKGCLRVTMLESFQILSEFVVKEYLTTGFAKKDKNMQIYPKELKILPGLIEPDILQSIQQSPGINSPFETASGIHVRGGSPDQNLVLWNGIKTYNQGHFFGMLSAFNPYISHDVSFIKNGTNPKYGDRVASVIDIRTSNEVPEKATGGAGFNMIYGDAFIELPVIEDKLSVQLSGRRSYTDLIQTPTFNQLSDRVFQNTKISSEETTDDSQQDKKFFFNDFTTNIVFKTNKNSRLTFNSLYTQNKLDFSSRLQDQSQQFNDVLNTANEGYNLNWALIGNDHFNMDADLYFARYILSYEFRNIEQDTIEISTKQNLIKDLGANLNASYRFNDRHTVLGGYQYSNNFIQYAFATNASVGNDLLYELNLDQNRSTINTHSFYGQYQFSSKVGTTLQAGARVNHYQDLNETFFEPRFYVEQSISDIFKLNATAEYRSQTASQIKESVVSDLSLENQVWTLASNDRFPVIDSYQFTTGGTLEFDDWIIDGEAYIKRINGITTLTFGFLNPIPIDSSYLTGNSNVFGTDLFVKKHFNNYKSWIAYSYIKTENQFFGLNNDDPFPGNWNIEHTIKWSHFYTYKQFQFSLGWVWHTGKAFTNVVEEESSGGPVSITFDGINQNKLPVYHRMDLSAVYDFEINHNPRIKYRIGLSILNLYNRRNLLNREFRTTPSLENELIDTKIYSLNITPNLVFRVFF
ncbi:MAG: TonB-dependent receptor [bacterium]|nr:TonB-dependent receptor [bacterium]